jgi:hypothetical protein
MRETERPTQFHAPGRRGGYAALLWVSLLTPGCGGGDAKKDTGAGANQPVPATINCEDLCARIAACVVVLCNEDTQTTNYGPLGQVLDQDCLSTCTDADAQKLIPQAGWKCTFQSSCRMILDYDSCHSFAQYSCH